MKKMFFIILISLQVCFTAQVFAQIKPQLEINFDGDHAKSRQDNIELTFNNITYAENRYGKPNSAARFNGENSFVKAAYNINPSKHPSLSIILWAKADISRPMTILSHDDGEYDRTIAIDDRDGGIKWSAFCGKVLGAKKAVPNKWTFVAVVFDQRAEKVMIFVNGVMSRRKAKAGEGLDFFHIGSNPTFGSYFSGLIDDIRVYDQLLSEKEIKKVYNKEKEGIAAAANELQYYYSTEAVNADIIVRVGDVDNLGFGFPDGFDPFCGTNTNVHPFPWQTDTEDYLGTDRIMVGSSYHSPKGQIDGYTSRTSRPDNNPLSINIKYPEPKIKIKNVVLQMFVDDFQSPSFGSYFQVSINGKRLPYLENVFNALEQTGPTGKLINLGILPEDLSLFTGGKVEIMIDDPLTGAGDGFAIDFVQLLINSHGKYKCAGIIKGVVKDEKGNLLEGVSVSANSLADVMSGKDGSFILKGIPIGLITVSGQKQFYSLAAVSLELERDETESIILVLKKKSKESEEYISSELQQKGSVDLYGIHFDVNKDIPKHESEPTILSLYNLLSAKPELSISIIGHTDNDGSDSFNQDLSMRRAQSILKMLTLKGINENRLKAMGLGESSPVASNKTAAGKSLNRRVEIRINKQ